jgi:hypothetical protein
MRPLARLLDRSELLLRALIKRLQSPGRTARRMLVVTAAVVAGAGLAQLFGGLFR